MSKRKQLVEKIIREEMTGYAKKILDEGMRTPYHTMPARKPDRARNPRKMAASTMTSIVDTPDLEHHFVEEKISDRLAEEASESDSEDYGVNTTSATPAGGDDTGKIEHVPGYPLESDADVQSESVFRRWKQLALMGEGVDDEAFDAELEDLAPPVETDEFGRDIGLAIDEPGPVEVPEVPDPPAPTSPQPPPAPDTSGRLDTLGGKLDTARTGVETDMSAIPAPGGGNLMDISKKISTDFEGPGGTTGMIPGADLFDMSDLGAPPMDVSSDLEDQVDQLEDESPDAIKEAIRRVLKEKLLT